MSEIDKHWMQQALQLAQKAQSNDEVPVGAVLVRNNEIIGEGYNQPISSHDPSAHAEIIAIRTAAKHIGNYRLLDTALYVTLEPCAMCAGAMVHARIQRLVYATHDPKAGAAGSVFNILNNEKLNHRVQCEHGVLEVECKELLKSFFQKRR